jgi:hypothetical protein
MKFSEIKPGEVLSSTMYLTVVSKDTDSIKVKDNLGREFTVKGPKLIEETMSSASQYAKEEKIARTKAAEVLVNAGDTVFTAEFVKQNGEERVMVAKLLENENLMGRSNVLDLQETAAHKIKQVDHRTLKSLILKGTKYTIKK